MPNNHTLVLSNTPVRQDADERYCLNDLHKASGGEARHKPGNWLMLEPTKELIKEIETAGYPAIRAEVGRNGGTYASKELVHAYAMWVSPKFHLHVIRAYDALVTGSQLPAQYTHQGKKDDVEIQLLFVNKASEILNCSETSKIKMLANVATNNGLPSNLLPSYVDEKLTRSLSELLKIHGSNLSATKANKILLELGYLQKLTRPSTGKTTKEFWNITSTGLRYGKNEISVQNDKETQPRWYEETFPELLNEIEHQARCAA